MDRSDIDVLFVNSPNLDNTYQGLNEYASAVEPPTWALLLAESCRSKGFKVSILDCEAEKLKNAEASKRIHDINPRLVCFVIYGQNPNAGTTTIAGAMTLADHIKSIYPELLVSFVGTHVAALPLEVLSHKSVDIVFLNEGVYALHNLLKSNLSTDLKDIKGIGYKLDGQPILNSPEKIVPQHLMDQDLPGYAWDLLPYKLKPFDLYRAHIWHVDFRDEYRSPFAAIYTSLGCPYKCDFCMINIINRIDNDGNISASNSSIMRTWSTKWVTKVIDQLQSYGVNSIRISDEMFFLNKNHYIPIMEMMKERNKNDQLRTWVYSRIDTMNKDHLKLFREAGVRYVALGIESANRKIRQEVAKGSFRDIDIKQVIKDINANGISVMGNYLFGLTNDTMETMQETLDLALELNTEMVNFYATMALPGSPIHIQAIKDGVELPKTYDGYSFYSYECLPLPTKTLTSAQILKFRDEAWIKYFTREEYLNKIESKFGLPARNNIEKISKIKLKRRILGD